MTSPRFNHILIAGVFVALASFTVKDGHAQWLSSGAESPVAASAVTEQGSASWYAPGYHGRRTASGERYDHSAMTAAHRTLPFDTMVRVVREDTGEAVVVRINDRMASGPGHIIDLSGAAADRLDMKESGIAPVRIIVLSAEQPAARASATGKERPVRVLTHTWGGPISSDADDKPAASESSARTYGLATVPAPDRDAQNSDVETSAVEGGTMTRTGDLFTLQIGVFTTPSSARALADSYDKAWIAEVSVNGTTNYRVYYSRFSNEEPARLAQNALWENGQDSFLRKVSS